MRFFCTIRHIGIRFLHLNLEDKLLCIKTIFLISGLRLLLAWIPVTNLYPIIKKVLKRPFHNYEMFPLYTEKVIWTVEKTGTYFLKKKCLATALAVHILLNKKRIYSDIHIGIVGKSDEFIAHAWLQAGDRILVGGDKSIPFYFEILLTC